MNYKYTIILILTLGAAGMHAENEAPNTKSLVHVPSYDEYVPRQQRQPAFYSFRRVLMSTAKEISLRTRPGFAAVIVALTLSLEKFFFPKQYKKALIQGRKEMFSNASTNYNELKTIVKDAFNKPKNTPESITEEKQSKN